MFGNSALDGFSYKGLTYSYDLDYEDDNCKTYHYATKANGQQIMMDWSPYSNPSQSDFMLWVDLGCPERITNGPLDRQDLETIRMSK